MDWRALCFIPALLGARLAVAEIAAADCAPLYALIRADHDRLTHRLGAVSREKNWVVAVRVPNRNSLRYWGRAGYRPKPLEIKFKSATGGPHAGLVVEPSPEHFASVAEYQKARKTWEDNAAAWGKLGMDHYVDRQGVLRKKKVFAPGFYYVDDAGITRANRTLADEGDAFHADVDVFGIRDAATGLPVQIGAGLRPTAEQRAARAELNQVLHRDLPLRRDRMVQHGSELEYEHFERIHDPNAELLVVYPDGRTESGRAGDLVGPRRELLMNLPAQ